MLSWRATKDTTLSVPPNTTRLVDRPGLVVAPLPERRETFSLAADEKTHYRSAGSPAADPAPPPSPAPHPRPRALIMKLLSGHADRSDNNFMINTADRPRGAHGGGVGWVSWGWEWGWGLGGAGRPARCRGGRSSR
ncbi:hypothetical protein GCM10029963_27310 [Micromonospora andamanensis]